MALSNKQIKDKSDDLINQLGLQNETKKLVGALPLGWKQKLAFSMALFINQKLFFWMNQQAALILLQDGNSGI